MTVLDSTGHALCMMSIMYLDRRLFDQSIVEVEYDRCFIFMDTFHEYDSLGIVCEYFGKLRSVSDPPLVSILLCRCYKHRRHRWREFVAVMSNDERCRAFWMLAR